MPVAIPILISAVASGAATAAGGGTLVAIFASAAVGAALAGLGYLLQPSKPSQKIDRIRDEKVTLATRNSVVPFQFGRGRLAGNIVLVGNFHEYLTDKQFYVYEAHLVVAFCEGEIQEAGNPRIAQKRRVDRNEEIVANEKPYALSRRYWNKFVNYFGNKTDAVQWMILDEFTEVEDHLLGNIYELSSGMTHEVNGVKVLVGSNQLPVPFRNTAIAAMQIHCGASRNIPSISQDIVGPDLSIVVTGADSGANFSEVAIHVGYDAHTESFWYVCPANDATPLPIGIIRYDRRGSDRTQTRPPADLASPVAHAWYLGRHDIVLVHDPDDDEVFWFGYWGITQGSADWERYRPSPFYTNPILGHHLDELNGILHTLHKSGAVLYAMQMHLLTGRVDRVDLDIVVTTVQQFSYSSDLGGYVVRADDVVYLLDRISGVSYAETADLDQANSRGLFVSGTYVGQVTTAGVYLWDYHENVVTGPFGSNATTVASGQFGGVISAVQNTWTGHVTLVKTISGTAALINFIPSVRELVEDVSAMGSPGGEEFQWLPTVPDPLAYDPDNSDTTGWFRDWSSRVYNGWSCRIFESKSSLAGAAFALLADESTIGADVRDFKRWGAGLDIDWLNISSFESVNSRCVAGWRYKNQPRPLGEGSASAAGTDFANPSGLFRYAERYKFDATIGGEQQAENASVVLMSGIMACCNGYKTVYDGKLCIGMELAGQIPAWHLTESSLAADDAKLPFFSRSGQANRVRVQYRDLRNNYRLDWVQSDNEFDQNAFGRVTERTTQLDGIVRRGQAELVAQQVQDQVSARLRGFEGTVGFLGFAFSPGDVIEITHRALGVERLPIRVIGLDQKGGQWGLAGAEYRPVLLNLRDSVTPFGVAGSVGSSITPQPNLCDVVEGTVGSAVSWFNGGSAYAQGSFVIYYLDGAYMLTAEDGFAVRGYEVVTRASDGTIAVLLNAPSVANPGGGWDTPEEAVTANSGQSEAFDFLDNGPIGIRLIDPPAYENLGAFGRVKYQLCLDPIDGSGGGSDGGGSGTTYWPTDCVDAATFAEVYYTMTFIGDGFEDSDPCEMWDDGNDPDATLGDGIYSTNDRPFPPGHPNDYWGSPVLRCQLDEEGAFVGWYVEIFTVGLGAATYGYRIKPTVDNPYGVIQWPSPGPFTVTLTRTDGAGTWIDDDTVELDVAG